GRIEDESPRAAASAVHYGLRHTKRFVTRDELCRDVPRILAAMDQPSIDGVNTWFASKAAAEQGYKVVLSGIGGDELFCGYSTFARFPRPAMLCPPRRSDSCDTVAGRRIVSLSRHTLPAAQNGSRAGHRHLVGGRVFSLPQPVSPDDLPELMEPDEAREG